MGLFSFQQDIAMDLGTANTIIIRDGKIVVNQPSVVALDRRTDKMMAVGDKAKAMQGKENSNIRTIRPLRDGVIADFNACEQVELRAVRDSAEHAGGRDVYLIYEPMAAAIGIGLDVEAPEGNMVVDIGGGTTEIAVISLGGIVKNSSIRVAGDVLTNDIQDYMSRQHNVRVGERMEVPVNHQEIAHCLDKTIVKIETAILNALEDTPPELYADIVHNGIYLAGGGALLRGLDRRLSEKINIPFHVAEDPLLCVAKGTGVALKNVDRFSFLMR